MHNRSNSLSQAPMREIATAWPFLRPHVREAIITLIDADLIHLKLQNTGVDARQFEDEEFASKETKSEI